MSVEACSRLLVCVLQERPASARDPQSRVPDYDHWQVWLHAKDVFIELRPQADLVTHSYMAKPGRN